MSELSKCQSMAGSRELHMDYNLRTSSNSYSSAETVNYSDSSGGENLGLTRSKRVLRSIQIGFLEPYMFPPP